MTTNEKNQFRAKCNVCTWIMEWHADFDYVHSFAKFHSVYFRNHDVSIMTELQKVKTK